MKILHLAPTLEVGGAERFIQRLAPVLAARHGVEQRVIGLLGDGPVGNALREGGIVAEALSSGGVAGLLSATRKSRAIVADWKPDIVQTWLYMADLVGAAATIGRPGTRLVWNLRCSDIWLSAATRTLRGACATIAPRMPNAIVACGDRAAAFHRQLGYPAGMMSVIPNGYRFPPLGEALAARVNYRLRRRDGAIRIGAAGRYDQAKGYSYLLASARLLQRRGFDIGLVIAGRNCTADNQALAEDIARHELTGHVELLGELGDMRDFYASLDIFCLSSISEGFPNVLCEALAAGVPAVSTDAGDAAQIMGSEGTVSTHSAKALADGLERLLALPRSTMDAGALKAAERIRESYDLDSIADRYHQLYASLLAGPHTPSPTGEAMTNGVYRQVAG